MMDDKTVKAWGWIFIISFAIMVLALIGSLFLGFFTQEVEYSAEISCNTGFIDVDYVKNYTVDVRPEFELHGISGSNCLIKTSGKMPVYMVAGLMGD